MAVGRTIWAAIQSRIHKRPLDMDAPEKEWRREDGAHKKVHLRTVEYSVTAIGARIDAHFFLFLIKNIRGIHLRKDAVDVIFRINRYNAVDVRPRIHDKT